MPWYVTVFVLYIIFDRACHIAMIGRYFEVTPTTALVSLIIGSLQIWALVSLMGLC